MTPPDGGTSANLSTTEQAFNYVLTELLRVSLDGQIAWALEDNDYPKTPDIFHFLQVDEVDELLFVPEHIRIDDTKLQVPSMKLFKANNYALKAMAQFALHKITTNGHQALTPEEWTHRPFGRN